VRILAGYIQALSSGNRTDNCLEKQGHAKVSAYGTV
jgi:hypothetical protein